jgi:hypothetical protein
MNPQAQEERLDRFGEIINLDVIFFGMPKKTCRKVIFSHSLFGRMLLFYLGFAGLDSNSRQIKTHIKFGCFTFCSRVQLRNINLGKYMPGSGQGEPKNHHVKQRRIIYKYRERSIHGPFSSIFHS